MADLTPQAPEWVESAPLTIRRQITIDADPSTVWDVLADNPGWVNWFPGFKVCDDTSEPGGVDSTRFVHQDQFKVHERITRWEPGQAWSMTVTSMNVPVLRSMAENIDLRETDAGGTELTFVIGVELRGWARVIKPVLVGNATKALDGGLAALASLAAGQSAAGG